mgnify:CR=1 FL=1
MAAQSLTLSVASMATPSALTLGVAAYAGQAACVDVVVEELRIEHYFPADDATRAFFEEAGGFDRTEGPESV